MKNKVFRILLIVVTITLSVFCLNKAISVKADSGWDSDYDSGGSWDSGSDWDSGSSWDSDWSSSDSSSGSTCDTADCGKTTLSIVIFVLVIGCILIFFKLKKTFREVNESLSSNNDNNIYYDEITREEILETIPNFDIEEFEKVAYQIFYDTQIAWMNFNYKKMKKVLTDELYNTYEMELEVLKGKNQKNIMKDFELIESKLFKIEEENGKYIAKVILEVEFIDFVEDSTNHKVLRGSNTRKLHNTYILTFERSKKLKEDNICPKCGASVEGNTTGICEYCKSKIINDNYDWVMSKKEKISQK